VIITPDLLPAVAAEARIAVLEALLREYQRESRYFTTEFGDCWFCDRFVDVGPHAADCLIARTFQEVPA
jgi:hypothetical protein